MPLCPNTRNVSFTAVRFAASFARAVTCVMALSFFAAAAARAEFKLTVDLKDGDKIHDVARIVAHADSSDGIDKVEFYVDDQLKSTAQGIPYAMTWDTIADKEGKHTLSVTAYDSNGQTKKVAVGVDIDNELAMGAPALAAKAKEALIGGDNVIASNYSRRSLKADPGNIPASLVVAELAAHNGEYDKAVAVIEGANGYDADPAALHELAAYRLHKALLPENAATFASSIQSYIETQQKAADMVVAAAKAKDAGAHEVIGDALLRAGHFKEAQLEYQKVGDNMPISTCNRLALAYTLQDNIELAVAFLRPLIQDKRADRATRAILGLALIRTQKFAEARATVAEDLQSQYPAALIVAAYADVVNSSVPNAPSISATVKLAASEADTAAKLEPRSGDAHYVRSMVIRNLSDSEEELVRAITMSPFATGPYLDYAARIALMKNADRVEDAIKLVNYMLVREPDCISAKLVDVLLLLGKGRAIEAEPILDFQMRHTRSADVQMIAAIYLTQVNKVGQAGEAWDHARKMDPGRFDFFIVPTATQFLQTYVRKMHYRPDPYLTFESLYPAPRAPKPEPTTAAPAE